MKTVECANCGVAFAIPDKLYRKRQDDGKGFCCPNGHNLVFSESKADKLRKQVAELEREVSDWRGACEYWRGRCDELRDEVRHWQGQARGYKGQWARLRKKTKQQALLH